MLSYLRSLTAVTALVITSTLTGVTTPAGAATARVPTIRTTAVVFAPGATPQARRQHQVTVGLNATSQFGAEVTIQRIPTQSHGVTFHVSLYAGDVAVGESSVGTYGKTKGGDLIEVQIAIREANPNAGNIGNSIAIRVITYEHITPHTRVTPVSSPAPPAPP